MKIDPTIRAKLAFLQPNQVGLLAWSLLANPNMSMAGGIPGQPDPDTPQPGDPDQQPAEPGEPALPDEPPPAPVV
ncbi:hypothetical protein [Pseudomonas sp. R5(2019)]|uniref:hypothetical protein n=1 Tax=Pseudomonas sp. R5(2019) TaxID=2697566 RepID=UPI00141373BA|nr:hypothetical protein [Pseudomonas sp. R5(2019)]NBA94593.1 hypothetical protein [Pseudomonas sp. R5(2019)]